MAEAELQRAVLLVRLDLRPGAAPGDARPGGARESQQVPGSARKCQSERQARPARRPRPALLTAEGLGLALFSDCAQAAYGAAGGEETKGLHHAADSRNEQTRLRLACIMDAARASHLPHPEAPAHDAPGPQSHDLFQGPVARDCDGTGRASHSNRCKSLRSRRGRDQMGEDAVRVRIVSAPCPHRVRIVVTSGNESDDSELQWPQDPRRRVVPGASGYLAVAGAPVAAGQTGLVAGQGTGAGQVVHAEAFQFPGATEIVTEAPFVDARCPEAGDRQCVPGYPSPRAAHGSGPWPAGCVRSTRGGGLAEA
ncbi:hypothetical protein P280DRAFT_483866 [Massarina eburnea CBS 473.64]|uniref:Uncharacterized protein n=1 Tax=Massarina eburnea CBS 473.64 TaxID=1395130 RepID=A0A6A6RL37_9PLEO|nr:hypothetical protein P280DRAFT_483866 [Massarina eburnea CBS 473.64]